MGDEGEDSEVGQRPLRDGGRCDGLRAVLGERGADFATSYPEEYGRALTSAQGNNFAEVEKIFAKELKETKKGSSLVARFEVASLYRMAGNFQKSRDLLDEARQLAEDYEMRARLSANDLGRNLGAIFGSEGARIYKGAAFEKVMSHTVNALNHVMVDDMEGALVEMRVAREYQQFEREQHEKKISKAETKVAKDEAKKEKKKKVDADNEDQDTEAYDSAMANPTNASAVDKATAQMNQAAAAVRNEFENPFSHFLASILFRAAGSDNDAWVAIKNAYDLSGDVGPVRDVFRLMARRQFRDDPDGLKREIGDAGLAEAAPDPGTGEVVVVFENGEVARKSELTIPLIVPTGTTVITQKVAVPVYAQGGHATDSIVVAAGTVSVRSEPVVSVSSLAMKHHMTKMPGLIARGMTRGAVKGVAQEQVAKKFGIFGDLLAKTALNATEKADLRAWYTIPDRLEAARLVLPAGTHEVTITLPGETAPRSVTAEVRPGKITLVDVQAFAGKVNLWKKEL